MKNLNHIANIHQAAQELHKLLLGNKWYVNVQVMTKPNADGPVSFKEEKKEIVVFVRSSHRVVGSPATFKSWPIRYEVGTDG